MELMIHKLHPIRESFESRFWKRVAKTDGCWLWTDRIYGNGRGRIRLGRAADGFVNSSRASWTINFGEIPAGMFVLHRCDNAACVRPDHLFLGTQKDNMQDMIAKCRGWLQGGRGVAFSGEGNPKAKLTWGDVEDIRQSHANGESGASLAKRYNVTKENIYAIIKNKTWK